jgi:ABC-type nitrate/sulfonate/bicarbonate transport system substrate-binding protein
VSALGVPYQGSAYVVRRSWAKAHETEVLKFIRAIVAAHDYVYANKAESIKVLKAHVKKLSPEDLEVVYAALTNPKGGLNRGAKMNIDGVKTLLKLRTQYSEPKKNLTDPYKYVDLSYYDKAMKKK